MAAPPNRWLTALPPRLAEQLRFLIEADRLKQVVRANRVGDGSRRENTAEHSWHIALFAMVLGEWSADDIDPFRVVQMLILHDLVEIECGDTPLYDSARAADQSARETAAADLVFGLLPDDQRDRLRGLWDEFEAATTADARFAKTLDRLQPVIMNHLVGGGTWTDYDVDETQVRAKTARIEDGSPELWRAAGKIFAEAVDRGWLKPAAGGNAS